MSFFNWIQWLSGLSLPLLLFWFLSSWLQLPFLVPCPRAGIKKEGYCIWSAGVREVTCFHRILMNLDGLLTRYLINVATFTCLSLLIIITFSKCGFNVIFSFNWIVETDCFEQNLREPVSELFKNPFLLGNLQSIRYCFGNDSVWQSRKIERFCRRAKSETGEIL